MMKKVLSVFALIIPLFISTASHASGGCGNLHDDILNISEALVDPTMSTPDTAPSVVVGVVTPDDSYLLLLGDTNQALAGDQAPTGYSVYPLSSISKVLTGLIAAKGVHQGYFPKHALVRNLVAPGPLRNAITTGVTIEQVVSHYGGYTNFPTNLTGPPQSPGQNYSRQQLTTCLNNPSCSSLAAPGTLYSYSNLGIGILGRGLSDYFGYQNYAGLLVNELTSVLGGMPDTQRNEPPFNNHLISRIVAGFTPMGMQFGPAHMGVLAGSGEVLSTGNDMLVLLNTLADPSPQYKNWFTEATNPIAVIDDEKEIGYAMDIFRLAGANKAYAKAGGQAAYSSFITWSTDLKSGIFILTNKGGLIPVIAPASIQMLELIEAAY